MLSRTITFQTALPLRTSLVAFRPRPSTVAPRKCSSKVTMLASRPLIPQLVSSAVRLLLQSLCTTADDLKVDIDASSNLSFLAGSIKGVSITTSRIGFSNLVISGGAALETDEINVAPSYPGSLISPPRLTKPFSVSVRAGFTENDLNRKGPIRNTLETLLREIIATGLSGAIGRSLPAEIGGVTCTLDRVELCDAKMRENASISLWSLPGQNADEGKLILHAYATLSTGQTYRFAVRTGLCTEEDGTIVKLNNPELMWRNVTFPLLTIAMIGVRLDNTAKLTRIEIDKGFLYADGIAVISPPPDGFKRTELPPSTSRRSRGTSSRTSRKAAL